MANRIQIDSQLSIFVAEVQLGNGDTPTRTINQTVRDGAVFGLVGDTPVKGEDGYWYAPVDTAARIRVDYTGAVGRNAPIYANAAGTTLSANSAAGSLAIGYAARAKGAGAGKLIIQLTPTAGVSAA